MKRVLVILSVLAIVAGSVAVSCKKEAKDSIKLDKKSVTLSNRGESVTLKVTASGEFTAQPDAEWLSVNESTITAAPNYFEASRTANVTFYCGAENASVVVNQGGMGPKDVVGAAIDALVAADWTTFWELVDMPDAKKEQVMASYNEKTNSGSDSESDYKGYEILSESIDNTTGEAVVTSRYLYKEHDPSDPNEWKLLKRDGRWRIKSETLGK